MSETNNRKTEGGQQLRQPVDLFEQHFVSQNTKNEFQRLLEERVATDFDFGAAGP